VTVPAPESRPPLAALPALLAGLPRAEYARLRPDLEVVQLTLKEVLYEAGDAIEHVYFPIDSLISLLTVLAAGAIETGLVGREGMAGLSIFLRAPGADRRAVCQHPGSAVRLPAGAFLAAVEQGGALASRLLPYTGTLLRTAAQIAACNRLHTAEQRSARWLLMVADRVGAGPLPMTQQFMSEMLGVRRASVADVLGTLEQAGLIKNGYGTVTLLSRTGLEAAACECYMTICEAA